MNPPDSAQRAQTGVESAAQAAQTLQPFAGSAAEALFSIGVLAVCFLAVPVRATGAAYDLAQALGWKSNLHARPSKANGFYALIAVFTALAVAPKGTDSIQ